jgi:hypothetical protein
VAGDNVRAGEALWTGVIAPAVDSAGHHTALHVERWDDDQLAWAVPRAGSEPSGPQLLEMGIRPYSADTYYGNLVTTAGWELILQSGNIYNSAVSTGIGGGTGVSGTIFSATVGRIGVGSGTTAAAYSDTQLGTALLYKLCGTAPVITVTNATRSLVFVATFQSADANGSWQEFGMDQGTASTSSVVAPFINHGIQNMGSKVSGQVWTATATISFS